MSVYSRGAVGYHGEHVAQVYGEGLEVGVRQVVGPLALQGLGVVVNVHDAVLHLQLVVQVLGNPLRGVRVLPSAGGGADVYR